MLSLGQIDRVTEKINAIIFATEQFDSLFASTQRDIGAVIMASKAVVESASLKEIFNIILALGNYINPPRKRAFGFKLSALNNIANYKDRNGKSLLTFLIEHLITTNRPLLDFPNEIRDVEKAKNGGAFSSPLFLVLYCVKPFLFCLILQLLKRTWSRVCAS